MNLKSFRFFLPIGCVLAVAGMLVAKAGVRLGWSPAPFELVLAAGDRGEVDARTTLDLEKFEVLRYPSGKPRQYVSSVRASGDGGRTTREVEISVNHPLRINGWWIYQYRWGEDESGTTCTALRCVRDPGMPLAALGGLLLVLGALGFCFRGYGGRAETPSGARRYAAWAAGGLAVALPLFIIGRAVMRPEPLPALQSWMMAPHVGAYVGSYLILLFAVFGVGKRLIPAGFLLMTVGLVLGAVWGKYAWSEWWQFDPKENWSFFTWLAFAIHLHLPPDSRAAKWMLCIGAVLILVTLTRVNFSRMASGLHSYARAFGSPVAIMI